MRSTKKSNVNLISLFATSKSLKSGNSNNQINIDYGETNNTRSSNLEAYINNCVSLSSYDVDDNLVDSSNGLLGYYNNVLCLTIGNINLSSILTSLGINYNQINSIILELEGSYSPYYGYIDIYDVNGNYFDTIDCTDGHNPLEIDIKALYEQASDASFALVPIIPCSGVTLFNTSNAYLRISYQCDVSYLSIEQPPNKTTYFEGDLFDPTGLVVKLYHNDGSGEIITNYICSPNSSLTTSDVSITITYQNLSINQPIVVNSIVLESISIQNSPYKLEYIEGDEFEIYGLILKANYNNGSSVVVNDYTYSPDRPLLNSDNQIAFTYNNKLVIQSIVVNNPSSTGYFPIVNNQKANIGNNPFLNLHDLSSRFISEPISINRDSYLLSFYLIYVSNMKDKLSRLIKGLPKRFKTNYHQFLFQDGIDENNNPIFKYIDEEAYAHSFYQINDNLYFSYQSSLFLTIDINENDEFVYAITDENKNKLIFNNNGFLYRIINGYDSSNIKELSYDNNGYLLEIKDNRDTSTKISFVYQNNQLASVTFIYKNQIIKALYLSYDDSGLLLSIIELANNSFKELYSFIYNSSPRIQYSSFDRVEYIKDYVNHTSYHIESLGFNSILKDYTISKIESGYFDNGNHFVSKDSVSVGIFNVRTDDFKTINEVRIRDKNNIVTSYHIDKLTNITAVFEYIDGEYKTLYRENGIHLSFNTTLINTNGINNYINSHQLINIDEPLTIVLNSEAHAFVNNYQHFVFRFYLKLNSISSRVRVTLTNSDISSYPVDVNVNQYQRYQLVEIPFSKIGNHLSSLSLTLSIKNENDQNVSVEIGDIYIDKANKTNLYFNNGCFCFKEIETIKLFSTPYTISLELFNNEGSLHFDEIDLINTLKRAYSHSDIYQEYLTNDNLGSILFLNGNLSFERFKFAFAGYSLNSNFVNYHLSNSSLDDYNAWFVETISFDNKNKTRTYYRFNSTDYEVIKRNYTLDSNNEYILSLTTINKYNYQEKLLQTTESKPIDENNNSNVVTTYNYFNNGELREVSKSAGDEIIVMYEASQNNDGYITRRTTGLRSIDISYDKYLEQIITKNIVNDASITNSLYTKQISYNDFLEDISSVAFKYNNENRGTNSVSRNSLTSTLLVDNSPLYQFTYDETNNTSTFKRYNGTSYDNVVSIKQNGSVYEVTYFGNSSNTSITNNYDEYGRIVNQKLNNVNQVTFDYQLNPESSSVANIASVADGYITKTTSYSYNSVDRSISQINFNNGEFKITINNLIKEARYCFNNQSDIRIGIKGNCTSIYYGENASPFIKYTTIRDEFDRLDSIIRECSSLNCLSKYEYQNDSNVISSFLFKNDIIDSAVIIYEEHYSHDEFGNLTLIQYPYSINPYDSIDTLYRYDGFGRITYEENIQNNVVKEYSYDTHGRIASFDGKQFSYDDKGQLEYFGDVHFVYDNYGNRICRDAIEYEYERGHLLKRVKLNANQIISFSYDYLGRRYQKLINNNVVATYYYHGNRLIGEDRFGGVKIRYFYNESGVSSFRYYSSNTFKDYEYIKNPFGQIMGIYDGTSVVARYYYDVWGNPYVLYQSNGIGDLNPFRYKGYYYDQETGLYYLMSRYYDSSVGQFISPNVFGYLEIGRTFCNQLYGYETNLALVEMLNIASYCFFAKGHQGNMKSSKYAYWSTEELLIRLDELARKGHLTQDEKKEKREIETELKARGERNRKKRNGYSRSNFRVSRDDSFAFFVKVEESTEWRIFIPDFANENANYLISGAALAFLGAITLYVIGNDSTGIGVLDDFALLLLLPLFFLLGGKKND